MAQTQPLEEQRAELKGRQAEIDDLKLYRCYKEAIAATMAHGRVFPWPGPRKGRG